MTELRAPHYDAMPYTRCGRSGLKLPRISLGLWHNFGTAEPYVNSRSMVLRAFELGITHFDLANNYGPPPGAAERVFGQILASDLVAHRDEIVISSKAGYDMWAGPYGTFGSRKHMLASLDQSLRRLGLDYVDIFYHHRPDPETPMEETMGALDHAVRSGRALYVGLSNYGPDQTRRATEILRALGTPCLVHQPKYSMLERAPEQGLFEVLDEQGVGAVVFSPLAQGRLTDRYLDGIPDDSRAAKASPFLTSKDIDQRLLSGLRALNVVAQRRGQSLAQLAIAWVLRKSTVTSAIIGASRPQQIDDVVGSLNNLTFSEADLSEIELALHSISSKGPQSDA
jgi:L-glyceraldehyde 3-phosphate reductase